MENVNTKTEKLTLVETINLVGDIHKCRTVNQGLCKLNVLETDYRAYVGKLNSSLKKFSGSKSEKHKIIVQAINEVLENKPYMYTRKRYVPRNQFILHNNVGYNKQLIKYFGQIVAVERLDGYSGRNGYYEIYDELTGEYCGIAHRLDLIKVSETENLNENNIRWRVIRGENDLENKQTDEERAEIARLAAIVKERNEAKRQQREWEAKLEKERKLEKKKQRELERIALQDISGLKYTGENENVKVKKKSEKEDINVCELKY